MANQVGAHFEALDEGVLLVPLDPRNTQVGFNLVSVQVCHVLLRLGEGAMRPLVSSTPVSTMLAVVLLVTLVSGTSLSSSYDARDFVSTQNLIKYK